MIYVRPLAPIAVEELQHMRQHAVGRVRQRAHLVLLSAQHLAVPERARLFACSPATVRFWIRRFTAAGPDGLRDARRVGRPRKVRLDVEAALSDVLDRDPHRVDATFLATCWTTMLVMLGATRLQITVCRSTMRSALQRLGLRWCRPRLAMPRTPDPHKAAKHWQIAAAVVGSRPTRPSCMPTNRASKPCHWCERCGNSAASTCACPPLEPSAQEPCLGQ